MDQPQGIAPAPQFPERVPTTFDRKFSAAPPGQEGPVRFEEGLATDTDIPNDFTLGISQGYAAAPGRPNRNAPVWEKPANETMKQRAHVGSAAWIEAPTMLNDFVQGSFTDFAAPHFEEVIRPGSRLQRPNPTVVND